ncbi:MAG: zf-HC2 domain-containing protein, partial [Chloroflexota bacterium]|nr:zf-HC2 domain-containing protein [Chloroflexota bacterium]
MLLNTPIKLGKLGPGNHVLDQLAAYLDYELPEPARAAVREHLRGCPQCENELATLRAAKQLLRDLPAALPPRSFKLNPDQVTALNPRPAAPLRLFGLPRLALALRLASAVCCLLLLPLLGTSALISGSSRSLMTQSQA